MDYFDQRASGDLMTRVIEDVNSVERVLIDGVEQGSVVVVSIVAVAIILFATHPVLAWVAMIDRATACHGRVFPASRYLLTLLLPRDRHRPYRTMKASDPHITSQSTVLKPTSPG